MNKHIPQLKLIFTLFLFLCSLFPVFSQTADQMQTILQSPAVNCGQAAWVVLGAANMGNVDQGGQERAFRLAASRNWMPKNADASDKINLKQVSLLLMKTFDIKGGLWYSLFKTPHYAYREMVYQDVIQGRSAPGMDVSGELLLFLVDRILYRADAAPWAVPQKKVRSEAQTKRDVALVDEINTMLESQGASNVSARLTDEGITISLSNIQFLANSAELPEREKQVIREIAQILENIPARNILVSGHTAQAGTEAARLQTSVERAQSVADYLVELGVRTADEIVVQGYGSQRPLADNDTAEGMALNRRVEITILEEQQ